MPSFNARLDGKFTILKEPAEKHNAQMEKAQ